MVALRDARLLQFTVALARRRDTRRRPPGRSAAPVHGRARSAAGYPPPPSGTLGCSSSRSRSLGGGIPAAALRDARLLQFTVALARRRDTRRRPPGRSAAPSSASAWGSRSPHWRPVASGGRPLTP